MYCSVNFEINTVPVRFCEAKNFLSHKALSCKQMSIFLPGMKLWYYRCRDYSNLPVQYCHLEQDPQDSCCKVPKCDFTQVTNSFTGVATQKRTTTTPKPTTPRPSMDM